jgi:hypothetical protein
MVAGLASTEQSAREMAEGRNIFGFDVSFTPARPYYTPPSSTDRGLWNQAQDEANWAFTLETTAKADQREFDRKKSELDAAILSVRGNYYLRLGDLTGCSPGDPDFDTCVDTAADKLRGCDPWLIEGNAEFNACVSATGAGGQLREEWEDLRSALLEVKRAQKELENIGERINIEVDRSVTVRHEIMTNGRDQSIMEFAATLWESISVNCGIGELGCSVSFNPMAPAIAALRAGQVLRQAVADANIEGANSEAVVRNLLLDMVELQIDLEIAAHKANAHLTVFDNVASGVKDLAVETRRAEAYVANSPANDPSYRLQRDSNRLALADQLELAARASYLAAKRAEYEYAARLGASGFRISDIYRARTAADILAFLDDLKDRTDSLVVQEQDIDMVEFTLSVAQHVLGWTDEQLGLTGEAARLERIRRFREWAAAHTEIEGGEPVLVFSFTTSPADSGIFSNVIGQLYSDFWLHKVAGVGEEKPLRNGFGVNIVTSQSGNLQFRGVEVTQSGVVHLKALSGCIFEYRLVHPAALLGMDWPDSQDPEEATAAFLASINGQNGTRTTRFLGRAVSATNWQVKIFSRMPGQDDLDLGQLEDIELLIDTTYASRSPGPPNPGECIRIDY